MAILATVLFVFLVLVGVFLRWSLRQGPSEESIPTARQPTIERLPTEAEKRARAAELNASASRALRFDQRIAKLQNNPLDRSQLSEAALLLEDPALSNEAAMEAIYSLLTSLRTTVYRGGYPAGLNVEITNTLLGDNPRKVGVLPMDSPRINENGELVDEYGTPFWFHSETDADLSIVSAGPDRLLHTADDFAYPSD